MDQFILQIGARLTDWPQAAIDNPRYSARVVITTAVGAGLTVLFGNRNKLAACAQQLEIAKLARQQADRDIGIHINAQQQHADQITRLNQQLVSAKQRLQEDEHTQSALQLEVRQLQIELAGKQTDSEDLQANLGENLVLSNRLQNKLDQQENERADSLQLSQARLAETAQQLQQDLAQLEETERQSAQFTNDLKIDQRPLRQLKDELKLKNDQIQQPEQDTLKVEQNAQRADELEKWLIKQNHRLAQRNQQLQKVLKQPRITTTHQSPAAAAELAVEFARFRGLLTDADQVVWANDHSRSEQDQVEPLWQQHQESVAVLREQKAARPATQPKEVEPSAVIASLHQTINEQQNYSNRLHYDLEIKKLLSNSGEQDDQGIPVALIVKQQADQSRIDQLEKKLAGSKPAFSADFVDQLGDVTGSMEPLHDKVIGFYRKWVS